MNSQPNFDRAFPLDPQAGQHGLKRITLYDSSYTTDNLGDQIIMNAVHDHLRGWPHVLVGQARFHQRAEARMGKARAPVAPVKARRIALVRGDDGRERGHPVHRFVAHVHNDGARGGLVVLTRKPLREEEAKPAEATAAAAPAAGAAAAPAAGAAAPAAGAKPAAGAAPAKAPAGGGKK